MQTIFQVFILQIIFSSITLAHEINFNNGSSRQYSEAATLKGSNKFIQENTKGLWPRQKEGQEYNVGSNEIEKYENDDFYIIKTNNLPDHPYHTNNPNCAKKQSYKFLIPKNPTALSSPMAITNRMQTIGVALNGIVIAGPYDSQNKIAPYNRQVDQCSAHADPEGMYHYHFSPLCMKNDNGEEIALNPTKQIGWSFDGYKILGLADRYKHLPEIDAITNGHEHDGEFHYHATIDFPFFMGAYRAKPQASNFGQKVRQTSSCPSEISSSKGQNSKIGRGGKGKRPDFENAEKVLGISTDEIKKALGPPPGDFEEAAKKLGINIDKFKKALGR